MIPPDEQQPLLAHMAAVVGGTAVLNARTYLAVANPVRQPDRLAVLPTGGVGVSYANADRTVLVSFGSDGSVSMLETVQTEKPRTRVVSAAEMASGGLIAEIAAFLQSGWTEKTVKA